MPTQLILFGSVNLVGTAGDDFLLTFGGNDTVDAGDGDDFILGDSSNNWLTGASNDSVAPANIDNSIVWTTDENPFFADSTIPHTSLYLAPSAGEMLYSSVTVGAGETIRIDIDFGNQHVIGGSTDVMVDLYNSVGTLVASSDDGGVTWTTGDEGSVHNFDSLLTYTNPGGVPETYTIRFREFGGDNLFEGGETFVAHISVTGHGVTAPTTMGDDTLNGGNGDDTIAGQGGNDTLAGGAGNDVLIGGTGNDLLNGGGGIDRASYVDATTGVVVDLSTDADQDTGGAGIDRLVSIEDVSGSAFNDVLIGNDLNNTIAGIAGDDTILAAGGADTIYAGVGNDLAFGGAGNDTIFAGSGDDTLLGDAGNDFLFGELGHDVLRGGLGNDLLRGGSGNDVLDGGTGRDVASYEDVFAGVTVNLSLTGDQDTLGAGVDRLTSIEDLIGTFTNDTLTGNAGGNIIRGGGGNDIIDGGDNNDVLEGGTGDDTLTGGAGQDTASYESAGGAVTVDLSLVGAQNTISAGNDTLSGIERLRGSNFDDTLTGDGNANVIRGGLGNDTMSGGLGNDRLFGGDDNDTINGGDGADYLNGEFGDDTLDGGAGNDRLYDTRGTNTMHGGDGDDEITSGGGNDIITGGAGNDLVSSANGNDNISGGDGDDHLRAGNGDDTLTGGAGADRLVGGNNNDTLDGGTENDLLFGEAGVDVLYGGDGNDNLYGGANGDTLNGGAGADRFRLDSLVGSDTITDFSVADDTIMIDGSVFTAFTANGTLAASMFRAGAAAVDANDYIIYNSGNGRIFYDADGSGAGAQVLIATVTPGTSLINLDFQIYGVPSPMEPLSNSAFSSAASSAPSSTANGFAPNFDMLQLPLPGAQEDLEMRPYAIQLSYYDMLI